MCGVFWTGLCGSNPLSPPHLLSWGAFKAISKLGTIKQKKQKKSVFASTLLNKKGDELPLRFAGLAPNARRLADSRLNHIPHVVTSFRARKSITSEPADTLWRRTERKWMDHRNPVHIHAQHFNEASRVLGSDSISSRERSTPKPKVRNAADT